MDECFFNISHLGLQSFLSTLMATQFIIEEKNSQLTLRGDFYTDESNVKKFFDFLMTTKGYSFFKKYNSVSCFFLIHEENIFELKVFAGCEKERMTLLCHIKYIPSTQCEKYQDNISRGLIDFYQVIEEKKLLDTETTYKHSTINKKNKI